MGLRPHLTMGERQRELREAEKAAKKRGKRLAGADTIRVVAKEEETGAPASAELPTESSLACFRIAG